jgi:hypothetical protein
MKTVRYVLDSRKSDQRFIPSMAPEEVLKMVRRGNRFRDNKKLFYFGTPLGVFQGFGITQLDGVKKIYAEVEITNERNWDRFNVNPKLVPLFSSNDTGIELTSITFSLGLEEKLKPFAVEGDDALA